MISSKAIFPTPSQATKNPRCYSLIPGLALCAVLTLAGAQVCAKAKPEPLGAQERAEILDNYGKLPLSFIENRGQTDKSVAYYLQSSAYSLYFTRGGHALRLTQGQDDAAKAHTIEVELVNATPKRVESRERLPGVISYFMGPKKDWHAGIPTHGQIRYVQAWPGIDLSYNGHGGRLESVYTVAAHANPAQIKLRYHGQDSLGVDEHGNLVYGTSVGAVTETAPVLYQDIDGRRVSVAGRYHLLDQNTVTFKVADYDRRHALVIDPTLIYSGFIGGSGSDQGLSIAVDGAGNAYVTGTTTSAAASFPVVNGPDLTPNGAGDAFVAKVSNTGTTLLYAGYIGGSGSDIGYGIAVDDIGFAYVVGMTTSNESSFPVVAGPDASANGGRDGFIAKVNLAGTALIYCGYIGGIGIDDAISVAVDNFGAAYVSGYTTSTQSTFPVFGGPDLTANGNFDAFIAKVSPAGTNLLYAGFIGGSARDGASGVAIDSAGNAYVSGYTSSTEATFPGVTGPDLTYNGGSDDAFIAKVNAGGNTLIYAGYIGGSGIEIGYNVAVDSNSNAYVVGYTSSDQSSFPVLVGPDLTYNGGSTDVFITKINSGGTGLVYSGYIGGSGAEGAGAGIDAGVAVDRFSNAYVTGVTTSNQLTFPVRGGPDLGHNGGEDAFIAKVNFDGSQLIYAGYIGGTGSDGASAVAVDSGGNAYVTGYTATADASFPVRVGPDTFPNGGTDAFVAKISEVLFLYSD